MERRRERDKVEYDPSVHAHIGCVGGGTVHIEEIIHEMGRAEPVAGVGKCDKCLQSVQVDLT